MRTRIFENSKRVLLSLMGDGESAVSAVNAAVEGFLAVRAALDGAVVDDREALLMRVFDLVSPEELKAPSEFTLVDAKHVPQGRVLGGSAPGFSVRVSLLMKRSGVRLKALKGYGVTNKMVLRDVVSGDDAEVVARALADITGGDQVAIREELMG